MRSNKMNGWVGEFRSSFLSCEKDMEIILKKLFVDSRPYSDELKRLLLINNKDCLTDRTNPIYLDKIKNTSISMMYDKGYIKLVPKLFLEENQDVMNYILISLDDFVPSQNLQYRNCLIHIDIFCSSECWDIGNYQLRPLKIAGYIDGILNNAKLSGIGTLNFVNCTETILSEKLSGYSLIYQATHGLDEDKNNENYNL